MNEMQIFDESGNEFVVNYVNDNYETFKIVQGERVEPTKEELQYVLKEIKERQNNKRTYEDYVKLLQEAIKNGQITNFNELTTFINSCDLSNEDKNKLRENGLTELEIQDVISLRDSIIMDLRNNKNTDLQTIINFNVVDNPVGSKYCEIKVNYQDNLNSVEHFNETLNYNETLKHELIEPVLYEVAMRSKIVDNSLSRIPGDVNNRASYALSTEENVLVKINNTEYDYAQNLQNVSEELKNRMPINDTEGRNEEVALLQGDNKDRDDLLTDENGNVFDLSGNYIGRFNENGEIVNDLNNDLEIGMTRSRVSKNRGFTMVTIIIAITSFITSILFLIQMFILG